ncbi:MAG TPA: DUF3341 domain-containing protein [Stenomitos sp.]
MSYGMMAAFQTPEELLAAVRAARTEGYRDMDAYTPFPIEGLADALEAGPNRVPLIVLLGGIAGALVGYGLQYYAMALNYPLNVGGRPLNSWPAFIPITFELSVLTAAIAGVVGMLALNGLPRPYHPAFNAPCFNLATLDRFFLCIEARDPAFSAEATRRFLEALNPTEVSDVEG